jgi:hypothetical protein
VKAPGRWMLSGYANWTTSGWAVRVHGFTYKQPPLSDSELDDAAEIFLPGLNTSNLTTSEREESRNVTAQVLSIPWPGISLNFSLVQPFGGDNCGSCGPVFVGLKNVTTDVGEFDELVPMGRLEGVADGNGTGAGFVTKLDLLSSIDPMSECRRVGSRRRRWVYCRRLISRHAPSRKRLELFRPRARPHHRQRHRRHPQGDQDLPAGTRSPELVCEEIYSLDEHARDLQELEHHSR